MLELRKHCKFVSDLKIHKLLNLYRNDIKSNLGYFMRNADRFPLGHFDP